MTDQSSIRHTESQHIDTFRGVDRSADLLADPEKVTETNGHTRSPNGGATARKRQTYSAPMTASANTVIAAVDARRPGLSETKRNLLLYFCQGHQLAHTGDPLFVEALYATDHDVDVDASVESPSDEPLTPGQLNTIGQVLSRYGNLSPDDLRTLVQASTPWQLAIKSTLGSRIEWAWLRDWFRRPAETEDPADDRPTQSQIANWRARSRTR